jgi:hypothetical protein
MQRGSEPSYLQPAASGLQSPVCFECILRHLGLWLALRSLGEGGQQGVRLSPARAPPESANRVIEPCYDDPFPACPTKPWRSRDYDTEPVMTYANG